MQLTLRTFTQALNAMVAAAQGAASTFLDFTVGSPLLATYEAAVGLYLWLQWQAVQILRVTRFATSTGADCDSFGAQFQFFRLPGVAATGTVTFARYSPTNAAQIPVGTPIKTSDGTQSFTVVADTTNAAFNAAGQYFTIAAGVASLNVAAQAVNVGTGGNVLAGTIGLIAATLNGVDTVTNAAGFTNGVNAESDAAYIARFPGFLEGLAKATPAAVESAVAAVAQNLTCNVLNGVTAIGQSPGANPGNFVVAVDDGSGATPSATITLVMNAAAAVRPIGINDYVVQATVLTAVVTMTITCGTALQKTAAVPLVEQAISAYIGALPVGALLPFSRLTQIAYDTSANITNVSAVQLNGGTADLGGTQGYVVRVGSVTVS